VHLTDGSEAVRHLLPEPGGTGAGGSDAGMTPTSVCNDVIVDPAGNVWFTDSSHGRILRIPSASVMTPNSASVWLSHPLITAPAFGANGIDFVDGKLVVANSDSGSLVVVDPTSENPASTIRAIELTEDGSPVTLCTPDGLQAVPNTSDIIVNENGMCGKRHARILRATLELN